MAADKVYSTQFEGLGFMRVTGTQVGAYDDKGRAIKPRRVSDWRFVDLSTAGEHHVIGGCYPTREIIVSDVAAFAAERGFTRR